MGFATWQDLYASDLQAIFAVVLVPAVFLVYVLLIADRGSSAEPRGAAFVRRYAIVFAVETILDPLATGPLVRWFGIAETTLGTVITVLFVLAGDFRVFLLVFFFGATGRRLPSVLGEAALWTMIVPIVALTVRVALGAIVGELPSQSIWLIYEGAFVAMALYLRGKLIPERAHGEPPRVQALLRATATYVAIYYLLWATADVMILVFASDLGWALRIVPNQMYYALFVPFVYAEFFARR